MADYDILFALGYDDPDSVIGSYIRHVANGGLTAYKAIFQGGKKAGEPVYVHFLNGVLTAERLRPLLGLSDTEARVLYAAFSVHDINKLVQATGKSFNVLAGADVIRAELERIGVPAFFPEYRDYLEDIVWLVRYHSGHHSTAAEGLIAARDRYGLERHRLQRVLGPLMRALDVLDLSTTLDERTHKAQFLLKLNEVSEVRYTLVTHRVSEQRGLLTNLIHNQVSGYLQRRWELVPLLFYPDGVAYLAEEGKLPALDSRELQNIGEQVARAAARTSRGEFAKFIRSGNQGIKVDRQCLELGVPFEDIMAVIYNHVAAKVVGKRFKTGEIEAKMRADLTAQAANAALGGRSELLERLLERPALCPTSQAAMGAGELLRSYYIFLSDHFANQVGEPWRYLYRWLGLTPGATDLYDLLDARYHRAYVVAGDMALTIDALYERILQDGARLMPQVQEDSLGDYAVLSEYVARTISFSFGGERAVDFGAALGAYAANNHRQCCYCGSEYPTQKWMAGVAPANVTVQSFSNRLPGGWEQEPKKNVCEVCRLQFTLEKLTCQAAKGIKTMYLHLYPYSFYTDLFLQALRDEVQELLAQDTVVLFPHSDEAFRSFLANNAVQLPVAVRKADGKPYQNGIVLPRYSETVGNVLIFPVNCPGDSDAEQFLFALQSALLVQRFLGCKAVLTASPVPVLAKDDLTDLFVDNVPLTFSGLLPRNDLDGAALEALWHDLLGLHELRRALHNPQREEDPLLSLVRATGRDRLQLFFEAERLVEAKAGQGKTDARLRAWRANALASQILPQLRGLMKGGNMEQLAALARAGWADHIIGRSLERNSLLKPFDMLIEGLANKPEAFGLDTLRAQLTEDIFRHLEAIASEDYKPGRTKREKVRSYVDLFFDGVLGEAYRGNVTKLLADARALRSAYLFYLREQIPTREKGA